MTIPVFACAVGKGDQAAFLRPEQKRAARALWPGPFIEAVSGNEATPLGEGAIALVRLSGPQAIAVADAIFRGKQKPSDAASHFQQFG